MIPILGALPPESIFPFAEIAASSVASTGTTTIPLPEWVRRLGRYSFLLRVVGGWGAAQEPGTVQLLDASMSPVFNIREAGGIGSNEVYTSSDITPGYLSTDEWSDTGGATHTSGWSIWTSGVDGLGNSGTWGDGGTTAIIDFVLEGIAAAAYARLIGYPANGSNPTTFAGFSIQGLGRGSRDPWDLSARIAGLAPTSKIVRVKY